MKQAADYVDGKLPICTVIGFPNGYDTTKAKCFEAFDAVQNGADEIDMVINIGWVKDQRWDDLLEEIKAVKQHCMGKLLKVIIETCLLTNEEKVKMCQIVSESGAEYIEHGIGQEGSAPFWTASKASRRVETRHQPHRQDRQAAGIRKPLKGKEP